MLNVIFVIPYRSFLQVPKASTKLQKFLKYHACLQKYFLLIKIKCPIYRASRMMNSVFAFAFLRYISIPIA